MHHPRLNWFQKLLVVLFSSCSRKIRSGSDGGGDGFMVVVGRGGEGAGIQGFHLKFSTLFSILSWFSWSGQSSWSCLVPANDWARKLAQEKFVSVIKSRVPLILSPRRHSSFQILTAFFLYLLQFRAGYFGRCGGMWGGSGVRGGEAGRWAVS